MADTTSHSSQRDGAELHDHTREAVIQAVTRYDGVGVDTRDGGPLEVIDRSDGEMADGSAANMFEVLVDSTGRLELDEVFERQGRLIYCKGGVEIELAGFVDDRILVEVTQARGENDA
jgi:hypothetical protein